MLNEDQMLAKVEAMKQAGWVESKIAALRGLKAARTVAGHLGEEGNEDSELFRQAPDEGDPLAAELEALGPAGRRAVFAALFPQLAPEMEGVWDQHRRTAVVTRRYQPQPFRIPGGGQEVTAARGAWLREVCQELEGLDVDAEWLAGWGTLIQYGYASAAPRLVAAAIDAGGVSGERVLATAVATLRGEHEAGVGGRETIRALLSCGEPRAWEQVGKLLLGAMREEGLRQAILEEAHLGHPEAFRVILKLVLDEGLVRFSSVVRAADVWFGTRWDSMSAAVVKKELGLAWEMLESPPKREAAVAGKDGIAAYFAIWAAAFEDATAARALAERAARSKSAEVRAAAMLMAARIELESWIPLAVAAASDEDPRVAALAVGVLGEANVSESQAPGVRAVLLPLLEKVKKEKKGVKLKPILWPWNVGELSTGAVGAALVRVLDAETLEAVLGSVEVFRASERAALAAFLGGIEVRYAWRSRNAVKAGAVKVSEAGRAALLKLMGDAAADVRATAFAAMSPLPLLTDEEGLLRDMLRRKAADVRERAIARLCELEAARLEAAAAALLAGDVEQRRAAVELVQHLADRGEVERAKATAARIRASAKKLDAATARELESLAAHAAPRARLDDCLGLLDRSKLTPVAPAVDRGFPTLTAASLRILHALDDLIEENKRTVVHVERYDDKVEEMELGALRWGGDLRVRKKGADEDEPERGMLLAEMWEAWEAARGPELRDRDGLELWRAWTAISACDEHGEGERWPAAIQALLGGKARVLHYSRLVTEVLGWLVMRGPADRALRAVMEGMESAVARGRIAWEGLKEDHEEQRPTRPELDLPYLWWEDRLEAFEDARPAPAGLPEARANAWRLTRLIDRWAAEVWVPHKAKEDAEAAAKGVDLDDIKRKYKFGWRDDLPRGNVQRLMAAVELGRAGEMDVVYYLLHKHPGEEWSWRGIDTLLAKGRREKAPEAAVRAARRVAERAVELELERGDAPTESAQVLNSVDHTGGAERALRALSRLGASSLDRSSYRHATDRAATLSTIIERSSPGEGETPEKFGALATKHGIGEARLVELGVFAPRWAAHVEAALKWDGYVDAVWWLRAHTKDSSWTHDKDLDQLVRARISERSPVAEEDFADGAVDPEWFRRVYEKLGPTRWAAVYAAAKYACSNAGHRRAQLFADAMLNEITEKDVIARINSKRHQDSMRALGLLSLPKKSAEKTVLSRYQLLQEVRRTSRKHGGSMLQASEKRAVEVGMDNLARTAGYPDPQRLMWAVETRAVADLAKGPVTVKSGDVTVTLAVDADGDPEVTATKKGKTLASTPPAAKKTPAVAELFERAKLLKQQKSRMRASLETAMCRGDEFTAAEIEELFGHPVLRAMLERLVFVRVAGGAGYPDKNGKALRGFDGEHAAVKKDERLRISHPLDLLATKHWDKWQRECFAAERVQPFKQVFREVYVPTAQEKTANGSSKRYAGQQVVGRQAMALLGARGWVARPEEGVQRTFHREKLTAFVEFEEHFHTPAEVEGLTLAGVRFATSGDHKVAALPRVPARLFSEVMRDLDLVVSVAHRGGVDPEASVSTVESRASLVRETCRLLKLGNVKIDGPRAAITGAIGEYTVHLGSGTVHLLPGGTLWIVPVHAQHRGRIFLPFADQDPKTAEVLSKVLLLARDNEIRDPSILEQIRRK
ncbi:MAG: DUF4132 domain-containing protein [Tepidisphaera sp.]